MSFSVVIPARYSSSRLPGKPLKDIAGKPMIQHVYERALESEAKEVIIATDDPRIQQVAEGFGAKVCMTNPDHASGTDRLQEVVSQLNYYADDIVVNVQGDEPLIPPRVINQVAHNLSAEQEASIATLYEPIERIEDVFNPNIVQVVTDRNDFALYFSRAPIPYARDDFASSKEVMPKGVNFKRHIGIYAYRVNLLNSFVKWDEAPIESTECLEQLRALWNGAKIHVALADEIPPGGVDTEEDLERVRAYFAKQS
ncbi:3-deoxy-manno-octulosonate cytidylyltransferase [Litoribrevibacter albus]|uniref:3-deoxy-manno-octulosonate cytidylyltransferase n=1 Tax=Litoribrevibacter albus TaxID=1473156 RepID=A0AA37W605_9GAMM|nr:3-deoxy-manno-octulosonate cytidylyltransferase [Litoribrevibacter albus]GLQ31617.1 3-deoxy-manno-octulosonate cytidylyltransferase [Litoribrevibacter albus]